jgi:hypothetical protein
LATTEIIKWELSSDCSCEIYDEDTDTSSPSDSCWGCWDEEVENLNECVIKPWVERNGWEMNTPLKVNGKRMTWLGRSGYAYSTPETIIETLSLNGDFTLRFTLDGNTLEVVRSSHDELGAMFEFEKLDESEVEEW